MEKTQPGPSTGNLPPPGAVEPAVVEDKVFPDPPAQVLPSKELLIVFGEIIKTLVSHCS